MHLEIAKEVAVVAARGTRGLSHRSGNLGADWVELAGEVGVDINEALDDVGGTPSGSPRSEPSTDRR